MIIEDLIDFSKKMQEIVADTDFNNEIYGGSPPGIFSSFASAIKRAEGDTGVPNHSALAMSVAQYVEVYNSVYQLITNDILSALYDPTCMRDYILSLCAGLSAHINAR